MLKIKFTFTSCSITIETIVARAGKRTISVGTTSIYITTMQLSKMTLIYVVTLVSITMVTITAIATVRAFAIYALCICTAFMIAAAFIDIGAVCTVSCKSLLAPAFV